jgi:hypothetical protein
MEVLVGITSSHKPLSVFVIYSLYLNKIVIPMQNELQSMDARTYFSLIDASQFIPSGVLKHGVLENAHLNFDDLPTKRNSPLRLYPYPG